MGTVAIICIAAVVIIIVIILTILVYNQMLLLNEVNKRLLLMTKESIDRERSTMEELQEALVELERNSNTPTDTKEYGETDYRQGEYNLDLDD